jgi:hypothetical protein
MYTCTVQEYTIDEVKGASCTVVLHVISGTFMASNNIYMYLKTNNHKYLNCYKFPYKGIVKR